MHVLNLYYITIYILVSVGAYGVLKKFEAKSFWAFVPVCREYNIALCAQREKDGRTFAFVSGLSLLLNLTGLVVSQGKIKGIIFTLIITLLTAQVIYAARIYLGLIRIFGKRKAWLFVFIFFEAIAMLIFGYGKAYIPMHKREENKDVTAPDSVTCEPETIREGLTVNINERMIKDFFKKKYLIKDIRLNIPKGHMVLLLGGSGAGKTTFVNAVTGYEKANASIILDNKDVYRDYAGMKYEVGFVPQQDLMRGSDTVFGTLMDAAYIKLPVEMKTSEKKARVETVLEEFGLSAVKDSMVSKLSGGQRKRLSIAVEYIADPGLFILDEPDSGLDGVVARGLFKKLRAIADQGEIVMAITHTPDRVIDLFDDVIVLAKDCDKTGRLAFYGSIDEAREFFGRDSMEDILLSINQTDEGGEGLADEYVEKYNKLREAERINV